MTLNTVQQRGGAARLAPILISAAALALAGLAWSAGGAPEETLAFDHAWTLRQCDSDVTAGQRGFLDDAPGAGNGNDSVFLFVIAEVASNENCTWGANLTVSTASFPNFTVRAAANDNSRLWIWVDNTTDCLMSERLALVSYWFDEAPSNALADSSFRTVSAVAASGTARAVCVMLDDRSNSHAQRISALIDRITFTSNGGSVGWEEGFSRAG
jgi:hypothetical protein